MVSRQIFLLLIFGGIPLLQIFRLKTFKEIVFGFLLLCYCLVNKDVGAIIKTSCFIDEDTEPLWGQLFDDGCDKVGIAESYIAEITWDDDTEAVFVLPKRKSEQFYKISRHHVRSYKKIYVTSTILNLYTNLPPPGID